MAAVIVDIADAVVTALNAASLSIAFTAERSYVPVHELTDLDTIRVTVVPTGLTTIGINRAPAHQHDYIIDIGIQQRCERDNATLDARMALVEEVMDLFRGKGLNTTPRVVCVSAQNNPIFVPHHLDEDRVFTSIVTLTYRGVR